ncbi:MAG: ketoacyl-ACP synthase III [Nitrospira sp.]|nr:ketoacyl-ACP synthase III [Nitrospira sp.]MDE0406166.1 ketoacyl-ACP synthase III [Nitrospira sp.]MDE0485935.1 ketoacyl-ACP synthase III [Nitrospira sp.]
MRSRILGTGSYAPKQVLTNADLEAMVETSDSWIVERTGIRERRVAAPDEACSDLGVLAAQQALADANVQAAQLDLILVATCTGDFPLPSTASLIQHRLGAGKAAACDISAACCGFVYGLSVADAFVRTGHRYVLVIGSEVMSSITDWTDRNTCVLFGDGAGAVVLGPTEGERGVLSLHLHADGRFSDLICVPGGGSSLTPSERVLAERLHCVKMRGNETFKIAVKTMEEAIREAVAAHGLGIDDIDCLVPHQANVRILRAVGQRIGLPPDRIMINVDRYGNTSAASIPLALDEAAKNGTIREESLVVMAAFGAGLTWASGVIRW